MDGKTDKCGKCEGRGVFGGRTCNVCNGNGEGRMTIPEDEPVKPRSDRPRRKPRKT